MALMSCFDVGTCMMCLWQMVVVKAIHSRAKTRYEQSPDAELHSQFKSWKHTHSLGPL